MQNLYWKTSDGKTVNLVNTPFESEEKLESFVFKHQDLLEGIFIFNRQIRSGNYQGIPDMLGVDQDGKICLIEAKNVTVNEDVLPQVLQYAIWAETNPDSVKALWLESNDRPEGIEINWNSLELRVLIIGPDYRENVLRMSQRIGYEIELLKVTRFASEDEEFILIDQLDERPVRKPTVTKAMGTYGRDFFVEEHGEEATADFMKAVHEMEALAAKNDWALDVKFNKYHLGFMYGSAKPFGVSWSGSKSWYIHFRVPESAAQEFTCENWKYVRFDKGWKLALFRKGNVTADAAELEPLLTLAYESIKGKA